MDRDTKELLETMKNSKGYLPVSDLAKRFEEIDEYYNHSPWNLTQILHNIGIFIPLTGVDELLVDDEINAVDESYLLDWYISSVSEEDEPVWTEEHIKELHNDFIVIPRKVRLNEL